jgi:teichuronic acid exporter
VLSAPAIGLFFDEPRIVPIVRLLSIQFILICFGTIPKSLFIKRMEFKKISQVDFLSNVCGGAATLVFAINGWGVWSLVFGALSVSLIKTIGINIAHHQLIVPSFSFTGLAQFISFGSYVTVTRVLWFIFSKADIFIVGKILGKELLGFYSVSMHLASMPMEKLSEVVNQVAIPAYSGIQTDLGKVSSHFLKSIRITSFFAFPALWGVSAVAPELIHALLGSKWQPAVIPFQLLCLVIPVRMISSLLSPLAISLGRPDVTLYNTLTASILITIAILFGVQYGLNGAGLAWVIMFPLVFLYNLSRVVKLMQMGLYEVIAAMARPAIATLLMYASVMALKAMLGSQNQSITYLLALVSWGVLAYTALVLTINRQGLNEVVWLVRAS